MIHGFYALTQLIFLAFHKSHPHPKSPRYPAFVKFNDHISHYDGQPFDFDAANALIREMFEKMMFILDACMKTYRMSPLLKYADETRRKVFELIRQARQADRFKKKVAMLMDGPWRHQVMKELGGLPAMINWYKRRKHGPAFVRREKVLTKDERRNRTHAQNCAKASANPRTFNDPYKMDGDAEFRLAPLQRFGCEEGKPPRIKPESDYEFNGMLMNNFRGHKAPISVWPEEFLVFAEIEDEIRGRAGPKVSEWLEAIGRKAEAQRKEKRAQARERKALSHAPP